jgi:putative ABC transport system permease protein
MRKAGRFPSVLCWVLKRLLPGDGRDDVLDAINSIYAHLRDKKGHSAASLWILFQMLKSLPTLISNQWDRSMTMFKNYFKIALRGMKRQKLLSFINIAGLAVGMACCLLIFLWVRHEISYDRFHKNIDRLFLIRCWIGSGTERVQTSRTPPSLGPAVKAEYPDVAQQARLFNSPMEFLLQIGEDKFKQKVQFADPSVFDVFSFPFIRGGSQDVFSGPGVMIVSRTFATRHFGTDDPVGKMIRVDALHDFQIVGVMEDIPSNSTIRFEVWIPLEFMTKIVDADYLNNWGNFAFLTYVELKEGVLPNAFSEKISRRIIQVDPKSDAEPFVYPFKDYYLKIRGQEKAVRMFSLIAGLILLMACINFTNLTTARAERRAKEVGIRKVAGADRRQLIGQFFGESTLWAFFSLAIAAALCGLLLPYFRSLTGKPLSLGALLAGNSWPAIVIITLLAGILSGVYPGLMLSSLPPVHTVKGKSGSSNRGGNVRRVLVVVQSGFSILLFICTVIFSSQIRYMKTRDPGFARDYLVSIPIQGRLRENAAAMKHELLSNPRIRNVSLTTNTPSYIGSYVTRCRWEGKDLSYDPDVTLFGADPDFARTFAVDVVQGRFFPPDAPARISDIVINNKLAGLMGGGSPIGKQISCVDREFTVIGVVKDFNFRPLDQELEPLIIFHDDKIMDYKYMFMKIDPEDVGRTIAAIAVLQRKFNSDFPFEYSFLDEEFDRMYKDEEKTGRIIGSFTVLAGLISCLGLFGLSAFLAERRTREIGIRKVLGASSAEIVRLLYRSLLPWVLLANLFAWPAAYYFMSKWLRNFAFRTDFKAWHFILSAGTAALIAVLTSSSQTLKAARANPADIIRCD